DCVEWAASLPWCDGNVGMIGCSYCSFTQFAAAVTRPPHLKCIIPQGCGYRKRGPVGLSSFTISWAAGMVAEWLQRHAREGKPVDPAPRAAVAEALRDPVASSDVLPLLDHPLAQVPIPGNPFQWSLREENAFGYVPWEDVEVPALIVTGWFDAAVGRATDEV